MSAKRSVAQGLMGLAERTASCQRRGGCITKLTRLRGRGPKSLPLGCAGPAEPESLGEERAGILLACQSFSSEVRSTPHHGTPTVLGLARGVCGILVPGHAACRPVRGMARKASNLEASFPPGQDIMADLTFCSGFPHEASAPAVEQSGGSLQKSV